MSTIYNFQCTAIPTIYQLYGLYCSEDTDTFNISDVININKDFLINFSN